MMISFDNELLEQYLRGQQFQGFLETDKADRFSDVSLQVQGVSPHTWSYSTRIWHVVIRMPQDKLPQDETLYFFFFLGTPQFSLPRSRSVSSRNAPLYGEERCVTRHRTAARETTPNPPCW